MWAYGTHSHLRFGNAILYSTTGVQQGDPAGPVLFAFALNKALQSARLNFDPNVIDLWYADDGCLMGKRDSVATALHYFASPLTDIGLSLNLDKCALWIQSKEGADIAGVLTYIIEDSPVPLVILGYPIAGNSAAFESFTRSAVSKTEEAIAPLALLNHAQGESTILRLWANQSA